MTYRGSGICSQRRRTIGAILSVARPATIIRSAWRGVARGITPIRSRSNRLAKAAIISIAQHASPKVSGHRDAARPQLSAPSTVVRMSPPPGRLSRIPTASAIGAIWLRLGSGAAPSGRGPTNPIDMWASYLTARRALRARRTVSQLLQRHLERDPRQRRALHPDGELPDAGQGDQVAEVVRRGLRTGGRMHHRLERGDKTIRFRHRLALELLGHHRGRRLADRAALALEPDVLDHAVPHAQRHADLVAAQRVGPLAHRVGRVGPAAVARMAVVVENDVAIQLIQRHGTVPSSSAT